MESANTELRSSSADGAADLLETYAGQSRKKFRLRLIEQMGEAGDPFELLQPLFQPAMPLKHGEFAVHQAVLEELRTRMPKGGDYGDFLEPAAKAAAEMATAERRTIDTGGFLKTIEGAWARALADLDHAGELSSLFPDGGKRGKSQFDMAKLCFNALLIDFNLPPSILVLLRNETYRTSELTKRGLDPDTVSIADDDELKKEPDDMDDEKVLLRVWIGEIERAVDAVRADMKKRTPAKFKWLEKTITGGDAVERSSVSQASVARRRLLVEHGLVRGRPHDDPSDFVHRRHVIPHGALSDPPVVSIGAAIELRAAELDFATQAQTVSTDDLLSIRRGARAAAVDLQEGGAPFVEEPGLVPNPKNRPADWPECGGRVLFCPRNRHQYWHIDDQAAELYVEMTRDTGDEERVMKVTSGAIVTERSHGDWFYFPGGGVEL